MRGKDKNIAIFVADGELAMVNEFRVAAVVFGDDASGLIRLWMRRYLMDRGGEGSFRGILLTADLKAFIRKHLGFEFEWRLARNWQRSCWRLGFEYFAVRVGRGHVVYAYDVYRCWPRLLEYAARKKGIGITPELERIPEREFGAIKLRDNVSRFGVSGTDVERGEDVVVEVVRPMGDSGWDLG